MMSRICSQLLMLSLPLVIGSDFPLTDEQYFQLPPLFHLDRYDSCLSQQGGVFCLGTFFLTPGPGNQSLLFNLIQEFSSDTRNFNHTQLHRGYCVSSRCANDTGSLPRRFEKCVDSDISSQYGLHAVLSQLDYCKSADQPRSRPIDTADLVFAAVAGLILLCNVIGTLYDVFRNKDHKTNKYLMSWSVLVNWKRLTSTYKNGDERLLALTPLQGVKVLTLSMVIIAHTAFSHYLGYTNNPIFFEKEGRKPFFFIFYNGTVIVQTFVMISSFLLAYNLLLQSEKKPNIFKLTLLPYCFVHRLTRILPLYLLVVGAASTWWSHLYDGALWGSLVHTEESRCRRYFWTNALFVNNFYELNNKCLIQTWYLAVEMQLYIVAAALTLLLGRWRQNALRVFGVLFVCSIVAIFIISYYWKLESALFFLKPEVIRNQLADKSFHHMYSAPWGSLPSSMMGLFLAFLHYNLNTTKFDVNQYKALKVAYRMSLLVLLVCVFAGYWFRSLTSPVAVSLYTALDRPIFDIIIAITLLGLINFKDDLWHKFLAWRGFRILGRMTLAVFLVHWSCNLSVISGRTLQTESTVLELLGDSLLVTFMTYVIALPATLLIEFPIHKFFTNFM